MWSYNLWGQSPVLSMAIYKKQEHRIIGMQKHQALHMAGGKCIEMSVLVEECAVGCTSIMLVNRNMIWDVVKDSDHVQCEEVLNTLKSVDCLAAGARMRPIQGDTRLITTMWWAWPKRDLIVDWLMRMMCGKQSHMLLMMSSVGENP